jgi:Ni/Co efflux regulator RcnB
MKGASSNEHDKAAAPKADSAGGKAEETRREGPARVSHDLDRDEKWDEAAQHKGYQKGDQGGYKGDYDNAKYENRDFGFPKKEDMEDLEKAGPVRPPDPASRVRKP